MDFASAVVGMIATILGGVLSYAAFHRNSKKDSEETGKASGTMLTEIGYIKANTDEIKNEQREQRKTNVELISRLTAVESSAKQAHKRLDRLEGNEAHEG
jgi:Na+/glutamate symporter